MKTVKSKSHEWLTFSRAILLASTILELSWPEPAAAQQPQQLRSTLPTVASPDTTISLNPITVTAPRRVPQRRRSTRPTVASPHTVISLDRVTVTAPRSVSPGDAAYQTPGSSAFISREQIQRIPPTSLGDMFREIPGVVASGNRAGTGLNINIRGLQGMGRVATLVDGTQQAGSQYIGYRGHTSSTYIDPDFIGGIDIAKGPSSGPYGSGAMGGVVNMRTIEATDIVKPTRLHP
jgi:outer membrane receptor protein involved in Fe transport